MPDTASLLPELGVTDCATSLTFYTQLLGFHLVYGRPEDGFA